MSRFQSSEGRHEATWTSGCQSSEGHHRAPWKTVPRSWPLGRAKALGSWAASSGVTAVDSAQHCLVCRTWCRSRCFAGANASCHRAGVQPSQKGERGLEKGKQKRLRLDSVKTWTLKMLPCQSNSSFSQDLDLKSAALSIQFMSKQGITSSQNKANQRHQVKTKQIKGVKSKQSKSKEIKNIA